MTRQAGSTVPSDPVAALADIMSTVHARMNSGDSPPAAMEAYTLGLIMGIAWRVPAAVERFKSMEEPDG